MQYRIIHKSGRRDLWKITVHQKRSFNELKNYFQELNSRRLIYCFMGIWQRYIAMLINSSYKSACGSNQNCGKTFSTTGHLSQFWIFHWYRPSETNHSRLYSHYFCIFISECSISYARVEGGLLETAPFRLGDSKDPRYAVSNACENDSEWCILKNMLLLRL